ncbi:hypothetical protein [Nocardia sp. NPDC052566]|uniref:hypothetical protein n=1 Tax=Nocardia sp. NPDC052566 TaxID=3364330 RepID=UPI0037C8D101
MTTLRTVGALSLALYAALASSGCGGVPAEGPTNQQILDSTGLTVDEAESVIFDAMVAMSPIRAEASTSPIARTECRKNESGMRVGPPWRLSAGVTVKPVTPEEGRATLDKVDALASNGYTKRTSDPAANDRSRSYKDKRGFEIGASYSTDADGAGSVHVTASSPCAAVDKTTEVGLLDDAADIRATTRIAISVYNSGNWDALFKVSCGQFNEKISKMRWGHLEWRDGVLVPYDESKVDKSLENERQANFAARGNGWIVGISNIKWMNSDGKEDRFTPSKATADVAVRYERPAEGLGNDNIARYRAEYSDYRRTDATWHICGLDPI